MHRTHRYHRKISAPAPDSGKWSPSADASLKKIFAAIGVPEPRPFEPDRFQLEAVAAVEHSDCLVTAPTGAGKTWIAEQALARIRSSGGSAWYACPLKALSNAKYTEFGERFGTEHVGILTGDRKENPQAPIIVGTTEILRNQLYDAMHHGESLNTDLVVVDEAHFLGDRERGVVWEELMIYLPTRIPLLLLSATIGNAREIAGWLTALRGRACVVVEEMKRPVPLFPLLLHPEGLLLPLVSSSAKAGRKRVHKKLEDFLVARRRGSHQGGIPNYGRIMDVLRKFDLLPAIFFLKSRADCDRALDLCRDHFPSDSERLRRLKMRVDEFAALSPRMADHRQLWHLEHMAVGSHHSGQLPFWKLVLERLMTEGLLDAVFATTTVAAGVNFPARTMAFLNSDRFNGSHFMPLDPTEFHQMTGRAGRRGMDHIGFALIIPGRFMDVRLILQLLESKPSDVESQIKINFSMVLNLLLSHTPDRIEELLQRSFASYRMHRRLLPPSGTASGALWHDFLRHLKFLRKKGYVNDRDELTEEGLWASRLRVDHPLLIAECFRAGLFPQTDPRLMAALMAVFVNERETDDRIEKQLLPRVLLKSYNSLAKKIAPFLEEMTTWGFEGRALYLRPATAVFAWASGTAWERVVGISELDEGNLAMLILRTADHLRHVRGLAEIFPEAAATADRAIGLILRDPVVEE